MSALLVRFDAELRLDGDEIPEALNYAAVQQAVQDAIGYSGVVVLDVTEYEAQEAPEEAKSGTDRRTFAGGEQP